MIQIYEACIQRTARLIRRKTTENEREKEESKYVNIDVVSYSRYKFLVWRTPAKSKSKH